jgi:hypothetical protein
MLTVAQHGSPYGATLDRVKGTTMLEGVLQLPLESRETVR